VESAPDLTQLPLDVDLVLVDMPAFQADRLAPPQAGIGDRDDHGEVLVTAGQQGSALGGQQGLQRRRPCPLRAALEPPAGPPAAVRRPERRIKRDQWRPGGRGIAEDRAEQAPGVTGDTP
jgi:hypothetical protein